MTQLVQPNLSVTDSAGSCLRFTQSVWGAPVKYDSAWQAWQATTFKHYDRVMPKDSVVVWFEHWGSYGRPPRRDNWGHVVSWIESEKKFLSSPARGVGQQWLATIEEVERVFNSKYVGWSEDINGLRVASVNPDPVEILGAVEMTLIKANNGTFFLVREEEIRYVEDLWHVELLRRMINSDPNDPYTFDVSEIPVLQSYLKPVK